MKKVAYLLIILSFISCGKEKKWVTDVDYKTANYNDQQWIISNFTLNLGKNELPETLEILPRDFGNFRSSFKDGVNSFGLDLNLTSILNLPRGEATLPNGENVPIETNGAGMIAIPFGKFNGKAYLAQADDMTLVGVAITIKQLNDINLGETMMFGNYMLGNVEMTAGIFISEDRNQSGIAIFANLGSLWNKKVDLNRDAFVYSAEYISKRKKRRLHKKIRALLGERNKIKFINKD